MKIITTKDLSVGYGKKSVLDEVNIDFEKGKFISLLGPNGAGKTTLLRTLSKHLVPVSGAVLINDQDISGLSAKKLSKKMSVVLTTRTSPPLFSVFEFVAIGRYPHTGFLGKLTPEDEAVVLKVLEDVNALFLVTRDMATLSDGERQKVLIARALAQEPSIILLDEPTMHLDLRHRMEVMTILKNLCFSKGITVIASLHDIDVASKISDIVLLVKDGTINKWGTPEQVLDEGAVASLYNFDDASFNRLLGSVELRGNGSRQKIFVAGGMGSSPVLLRLLSRKGYRITTGLLHQNDIDAVVASSIGAKCHTVSSVKEISKQDIMASGCLRELAGEFIDTGFPVGKSNRGNVEILKQATGNGTRVYSLRKREDAEAYYSCMDNVVFYQNETELVHGLEEHLKKD